MLWRPYVVLGTKLCLAVCTLPAVLSLPFPSTFILSASKDLKVSVIALIMDKIAVKTDVLKHFKELIDCIICSLFLRPLA